MSATNRDREALLQELATIDAALLTSYSTETLVLMGLRNNLRDRLGLASEEPEEDESDNYRAA